ncbi:hypothetical protein B0H13DRAFT_1900647 [Mycena leptocephala]|nr:hypothetical protein B0H13DRAFT_1900647 [Mycena leptocephala]
MIRYFQRSAELRTRYVGWVIESARASAFLGCLAIVFRITLCFNLGVWETVADQHASSHLVHSTDMPFVRPRKAVRDGGFDGTATMLACHIIAGLEDNSCFMGLAKEESSKSSPSTSGADPESTHSTVSASVSSMHLPLEAHVLPGRGRQLFAALPFFCIVHSDNIVDLMSSVACQRHVWGIHQERAPLGIRPDCPQIWSNSAKLVRLGTLAFFGPFK